MATGKDRLWGWNDPRLIYNEPPKTWQEKFEMAIARVPYEADLIEHVRHIVRDAREDYRRQSELLASEVRLLKQRVEHLSGFMQWVMHAYPDTIVQYNALMELQRASNPESKCEAVESGP